MFFRANRDKTALHPTDVENLLGALKTQNHDDAFARVTRILDRAANGPPMFGSRFKDVLYWKLDKSMRSRFGELEEQLTEQVTTLESAGDIPANPLTEKLGVPWALIFELVQLVIQIIKDIKENRATTGNEDSGDYEEEDGDSGMPPTA
jgi:hypothetical protein